MKTSHTGQLILTKNNNIINSKTSAKKKRISRGIDKIKLQI